MCKYEKVEKRQKEKEPRKDRTMDESKRISDDK